MTCGYADNREYWEEIVLSLASARELDAANIKKVKEHYKQQYNHQATSKGYNVGNLVLVKFSLRKKEETKRCHTLSMVHVGLSNVMICG